MIDKLTMARIEKLERKVALLRGESDPGEPCPGTHDSDCRGGMVERESGGWTECTTCKGSGRIFPELSEVATCFLK